MQKYHTEKQKLKSVWTQTPNLNGYATLLAKNQVLAE